MSTGKVARTEAVGWTTETMARRPRFPAPPGTIGPETEGAAATSGGKRDGLGTSWVSGVGSRGLGTWMSILAWRHEPEVARREEGVWRLYGYQQ